MFFGVRSVRQCLAVRLANVFSWIRIVGSSVLREGGCWLAQQSGGGVVGGGVACFGPVWVGGAEGRSLEGYGAAIRLVKVVE